MGRIGLAPQMEELAKERQAAALAKQGGLTTLSVAFERSFEQLFKRARGEEKPISMSHLPLLGEALGGGWWPGLHVIVGGPKSGKTQFALQQARHSAEDGTPTLYIGLELMELEVVIRLACLDPIVQEECGHVTWSDALQGKCPVGTLEKLYRSSRARLKDLPFWLRFGAVEGWTIDKLREDTMNMCEEYPERPPLVVLDFLQRVGDSKEGPRRELRERISCAAYAARELARETEASVLLVSSTARDQYKANGKEPAYGSDDPARFMGTGKESGDIEYAADNVLVLLPEAWTKEEREKKEPRVVWCAVAASRANVPAWVDLKFDGNGFREAKDKPANQNHVPPYIGRSR